MKYYQINGNVHAYEADGSQDDFIPEDAIPMTSGEVAEYLNPPKTKADLLAYSAKLRWQKEVGGITVNGISVATDDRSKLLAAGARKKAEANQNYTVGWKTAEGTFVQIDAVTIAAIDDAITGHVEACFALEEQIASQIEAGTITTLTAIEAAFA